MTLGCFILKLWRLLKSGALVSLLFIIIITVLQGVVSFYRPAAELVSENPTTQGIVILLMIMSIGAVYRILKKRKVFFLELLPTAVLEKPEVMWEVIPGTRRYQTGILLEVRPEYTPKGEVVMASIMLATAGPTTVGGMGKILVPQSDITTTGRHGSDVFSELATLGGKTTK